MNQVHELMECVAMIAAIGFGISPQDAENALPDIMKSCKELDSYKQVSLIVDATSIGATPTRSE